MIDIDYEIREKVLGISWDETRCRICGWPLAQSVAQGCVIGSCSLRIHSSEPPRRADYPPPYSTEMMWAWSVVEAMRSRHHRNCLVSVAADSGMTTVTFFSGPHDQGAGSPLADAKAPLAICRAALAALAAPR